MRKDDIDPIQTGPFSHQWKDEVPVGLKNFAGLCPKNYIYETLDNKCKWVCKGLSLSSFAAKHFTFKIAKQYLLDRNPDLTMILYDRIEDVAIRERLKRIHIEQVAKGYKHLIFDDGINISRDWKKPGGAFKIDDNRNKIIKAKFDKRTLLPNRVEYMLNSIVKIRSVPFGTTSIAFEKYI